MTEPLWWFDFSVESRKRVPVYIAHPRHSELLQGQLLGCFIPWEVHVDVTQPMPDIYETVIHELTHACEYAGGMTRYNEDRVRALEKPMARALRGLGLRLPPMPTGWRRLRRG